MRGQGTGRAGSAECAILRASRHWRIALDPKTRALRSCSSILIDNFSRFLGNNKEKNAVLTRPAFATEDRRKPRPSGPIRSWTLR